MRISTSIAWAISALYLTACSTLPPPASSSQVQPPAAVSVTTLESHHWTLQKAWTPLSTPDTQWFLPATGQRPATTVHLDFLPAQRLFVQRLCNTMNGSYRVQGQQLHIDKLASSMMLCADNALMQLEQKVGLLLPQSQSWTLQGETLEIRFKDGQRWELAGQAKYSTLYGAPEQVFLEVAPTLAPCPHPLQRDAQCLQVRSVHYDSQGIKRQVGPWEHFYDRIEGFTHQEGVRNVLRLQRYTRPNAPADASKYLYVHDLTVETERVR